MNASGAEDAQPVRIAVIGPTSLPWAAIRDEVEDDLERLRRGVALSYHPTGAGPEAVTSAEDAAAAAPHVVTTALEIAARGFDGIVVDCTEDPGVAEARGLVGIPVVGTGEALRAAIEHADGPIVALSGDELRELDENAIVRRARGARTVALGGSGFSHLADVLGGAVPGAIVLDPLAVALDACLASLGGGEEDLRPGGEGVPGQRAAGCDAVTHLDIATDAGNSSWFPTVHLT